MFRKRHILSDTPRAALGLAILAAATLGGGSLTASAERAGAPPGADGRGPTLLRHALGRLRSLGRFSYQVTVDQVELITLRPRRRYGLVTSGRGWYTVRGGFPGRGREAGRIRGHGSDGPIASRYLGISVGSHAAFRSPGKPWRCSRRTFRGPPGSATNSYGPVVAQNPERARLAGRRRLGKHRVWAVTVRTRIPAVYGANSTFRETFLIGRRTGLILRVSSRAVSPAHPAHSKGPIQTSRTTVALNWHPRRFPKIRLPKQCR